MPNLHYMLITWVFVLLAFTYCLFTLSIWYYWERIPFFHCYERSCQKVSIIVPVRNEEANIYALLKDLDEQRWPDQTFFSSEQLEVIVVNDHSEDKTAKVVNAFVCSNIKLSLLNLVLPPGFKGSHKKLAISQAIARSRGEIIVTTDGDCRVPPYWIAVLLSFIKAKQLLMVSAPVIFGSEKDLFQRLQTIEFASLIGSGAACMEAGVPNMCNGANLAFTKQVFVAVGGYGGSMHIPSGDDEFLLQKVHQYYPGQVKFLKSKAAVVSTAAQPNIKSFYHQRKRWAGKWKLHKNLGAALLAVFIFMFHASLICALVLMWFGWLSWIVFVAVIGTKASVEFLFLRSVLSSMNKKLSISNFLLLQGIYSAYAVFFGIAANFGGYQWKARHYSGHLQNHLS